MTAQAQYQFYQPIRCGDSDATYLNQHRGFRGELRYDAKTLRKLGETSWIVNQIYFYLWDFSYTAISDQALENIRSVLDNNRSRISRLCYALLMTTAQKSFLKEILARAPILPSFRYWTAHPLASAHHK
jgi:hypothetical protein